MRQTIKEINVNVAYRWFIGYGLTEKIPHFSTFGKNYTRRFKDTPILEPIFERILKEAVAAGFIDASAIFIDGTQLRPVQIEIVLKRSPLQNQ
jgi:transposase